MNTCALVAARVRTVRIAHRWSVEVLAWEAGIAYRTLQDLEAGRHVPRRSSRWRMRSACRLAR